MNSRMGVPLDTSLPDGQAHSGTRRGRPLERSLSRPFYAPLLYPFSRLGTRVERLQVMSRFGLCQGTEPAFCISVRSKLIIVFRSSSFVIRSMAS